MATSMLKIRNFRYHVNKGRSIWASEGPPTPTLVPQYTSPETGRWIYGIIVTIADH